MLKQIYLYPIKSTRAYQVSQAIVQTQGLNFDREFMITDTNGKFITARKHAVLYDLSVFPVSQGIQIHHKNGEFLFVKYSDFSHSSMTEVWNNHFSSFVAKAEINQWLSEKIQENVQLRWLGEQSKRRIMNEADRDVSFADGYPLLLCTENSLQALQKECPTIIQMLQFRPNLVIQGDEPFSEQNWHEIQIGNIKFIHTHPCTRCILTTRDLITNQLNTNSEPFRTLKRINCNTQGKPLFGINLIPLNTGIIRDGDKLRILSYK